jgi:hypothetical protein
MLGAVFIARTVFEVNIGEIPGNLDHGVHIAERGGEYHLEAIGCILANDPDRIGPLGHAFDNGGFDLVAEFGFQHFAAVVMLIAPSQISHRADIDEGDFSGLGSFSRCRSPTGKKDPGEHADNHQR